jgi:hypothetical protein
MPDGFLGIRRHEGFFSRKAALERRKLPANSAQALEKLISATRTASIRGRGASTPEEVRGLASLEAAPETLLGRQQQVLIERIRGNGDRDPFAAAGNDRQHRRPE